RKFRNVLQDRLKQAGEGPVAKAGQALDQKVAALAGQPVGRRGAGPRGGTPGEVSLSRVHGQFLTLLALADGADVAPTTQAPAAAEHLKKEMNQVMQGWHELKTKEGAALNALLKKANLAPIED